MKKLFTIILLLCCIVGMGQSFSDKIKALITAGGSGTAFISIQYSNGNYSSSEGDVITISPADTSANTFVVHSVISDSSGKTRIDTTITLTSAQVNAMNNFYQSASNNTNPNSSLSAISGATSQLTVKLCCAGNTDITYSSNIHVTLGRYLLGYWNNWQ